METGPDSTKVLVDTGFARRGDFPKWDLCFQLKQHGFPQKRQFQAMYYVRPDILVCIDDLSALKSDGFTDFENIFSTLVFNPTLADLWRAVEAYLHEIVKMSDGTYFAYSTVEEDPDYILETGRVDKFIRARGDNPWLALVNLYIAVAKRYPLRTLTPEELDASENRQDAIIDPNLT